MEKKKSHKSINLLKIGFLHPNNYYYYGPTSGDVNKFKT